MSSFTADELNKIIASHELWLMGDTHGERADLSHADLRGADPRNANLRNADLRCADLRGADLRCSDLCEANLRGANLSNANLRNAYLCSANLCYADLRGANLSNADLHNADLRNANLRNADLSNADLCGASCGTARMPKGWWCMDQRYLVHVCAEYIEIGCRKYTGTEWEAFSECKIAAMDPGALEWWKDFGVLVIGKWHEIKAGKDE